MKNNQFIYVLVVLLLVSTVASAAIIFKWRNYYNREMQIQGRMAEFNNSALVMNQLLSELSEYARSTGNKDAAALVQQASTPPQAQAQPRPMTAPARPTTK